MSPGAPEPQSPAIPSGDQGEKEYPGGTTGDNLEEEDGRNPEIRVPVKTKDGRLMQPPSVEEDAKEEERQWRTPPTHGRDKRCE
ncbi:hypothetical protein NDU88_006473 [Pleurodeles waltl]|uniref:Uncharacterized protein n=1 Tax=Pleurodeles waltl TaxID=8319 RepID=A0AAV7RQC1_PLEWA|nr:hypothetical protein NDU88_006473 [Pleurodeles waltl]